MDLNASFIPKNDIKSTRPKAASSLSTSVFLLIGIIIFLSTALAAGGVYLYDQKITTDNQQAIQDLQSNRESYSLDAIEEFQRIDRQIQAAEKLLDNHVSLIPVFELLENDTLTAITLSGFSLSSAEQLDEYHVNAEGTAESFEQVALQADSYSTNKNIKNLILSGVNQDRDGDIRFRLAFDVDRDFLLVTQ